MPRITRQGLRERLRATRARLTVLAIVALSTALLLSLPVSAALDVDALAGPPEPAQATATATAPATWFPPVTSTGAPSRTPGPSSPLVPFPAPTVGRSREVCFLLGQPAQVTGLPLVSGTLTREPDAGAATVVEFAAPDCMSTHILALPAEERRLEVQVSPVFNIEMGAEVVTVLNPTTTNEGVRWRGQLQFPSDGVWTVSVALTRAVLEERDETRVFQMKAAVGTYRVGWPETVDYDSSQAAALISGEHRVLADDGTELARWPAEGYSSGWLQSPERVVFIQRRAGVPWVVAGDPATEVVTPLLATGELSRVVVSPAGNALIVVEYNQTRLWREGGHVLALPVFPARHGRVAWSPEGSLVVIAREHGDRSSSERARLFRSDGTLVYGLDFPEGVSHDGSMHWADGGKLGVWVAGRRHIYRISPTDARPVLLLDIGEGHEVAALGLSPDGARLALAYTGEHSTFKVMTLATDAPGAVHEVASYPAVQNTWARGMAWSPDGQQFAVITPEPRTEGAYFGSTWIRFFTREGQETRAFPMRQHCTSGLRWAREDAVLYFSYGSKCNGGGGGSYVSVVQIETGAILGTADGGDYYQQLGPLVRRYGQITHLRADGRLDTVFQSPDLTSMRAIALSPAGLTAVLTADRAVAQYERQGAAWVRTGIREFERDDHMGRQALDLASPDGRFRATADNKRILLKTADGTSRHIDIPLLEAGIPEPGRYLPSLAWQDNQRLYVLTAEGLFLLDISSRRADKIAINPGPRGDGRSEPALLSASPDGKTLLLLTRHAILRYEGLGEWALFWSLPLPTTHIVWSPDSSAFLAAYNQPYGYGGRRGIMQIPRDRSRPSLLVAPDATRQPVVTGWGPGNGISVTVTGGPTW